jgi:hypothetical protein
LRGLPGGAEGIRTSDLRSVGAHALDGAAASEPASTQAFGRNAQIAAIRPTRRTGNIALVWTALKKRKFQVYESIQRGNSRLVGRDPGLWVAFGKGLRPQWSPCMPCDNRGNQAPRSREASSPRSRALELRPDRCRRCLRSKGPCLARSTGSRQRGLRN